MRAYQSNWTRACALIALLALAAPTGAWALAPGAELPPAEFPAATSPHLSGTQPQALTMELTYADALDARGLASTIEVRLVASRDGDVPDIRVAFAVQDALRGGQAEQRADLRAGESATLAFSFLLATPGDHFVAVTATSSAEVEGAPVKAYRQGWVEVPAVVPGLAGAVGPATFRPDQPMPPDFPGGLEVVSDPLGTTPASFEGPEPGPATGVGIRHAQEGGDPYGESDGLLRPDPPPGGEGGADASTFKVKGCWNFLDGDGLWYRQRWATWELMDSDYGADDTLASGVTGANGCFESGSVSRYEYGSNPQDLYLVVYACNTAVCASTEWHSGFHQPRTTHVWSSEGEGYYNGAAVPVVWNVGERGAMVADYAARVFQYANNAWAWGVDFGGFTVGELEQIDVLLPSTLDCAPCLAKMGAYEPHLYMKVDGSADKNPDTTAHEYAHWTMDRMYGYNPGPGGPHSWCDPDQNRGLAWSEGYAHFYGARANFDLVNSVNTPVPGADGDTAYSTRNLENTSCGMNTSGWNEMRVAKTLWDLRDAPNDGFDWGLWGMKDIIGIVRGCTHDDLREFYDAAGCSWKQKGYSRCLFLRAAFNNEYDFNLRPLVEAVTAPSGGGWVSGQKSLQAAVDGTDGACDTTVSFYASLNDTCTTQDPLLDAVPIYQPGTWDTTDQDDGDSYYVCARANDTMEQDWGRTAAKFSVDNADPLLDVDLAGNLGNQGWYRSPVGVSLTCTDAHSGVAKKELNLDNQGYDPYTGGKLVFGQGFHTYGAICGDVAGNYAGEGDNFRVDSQDPGTILVASPPSGDDGWYLGTATLSLTCLDPVPGSGCAGSQWSTGFNFLQPYTGPIQVTANGVTTVNYRSTDVAGNVEDQHQHQVRIDKVAPTLDLDLSGTQGGNLWWHSVVYVTLSCQDGTSGVKPGSLKYRLNAGPLLAYTGAFGLTAQGETDVTATCADVAGNNANAYATVKIDSKKPVTTHALQGTPGSGSWYRSSVKVTLACDDDAPPGSGCAITRYTIDNGPTIIYSGPFTVAAQGMHTVRYYSQDDAANTEALKLVTFGVDTAGPQVDVAYEGGHGVGEWWRSDVDVVIGCLDAVSGPGPIQVSIGYGPFQFYTQPVNVATQGFTEVDAICYDQAGNIGSKVRPLYIDSALPTGGLLAEQKEDIAALSWSAQDVTSGVAVAVLVEQSFAGGPFSMVCGTWETGTGPIEGVCEVPLDDQGEYCWRLNVEDAAGNALVSAPQCITHITPG